MMRLAITGGIGCGKSLCGEYLRELGCPVCDTDVIAHELLERGTAWHAAVVQTLGDGFQDSDGTINRRRLGDLVFEDLDALTKLNRILHPEIRRRMHDWIRTRNKDSAAAAVLIPLFFEVAEQPEDWDRILCVAASERVCRQRLRRRGWSKREIEARNRTQWPLSEKIRLADVVFYNDGLPGWLCRQVNTFYFRDIQREKQEHGR